MKKLSIQISAGILIVFCTVLSVTAQSTDYSRPVPFKIDIPKSKIDYIKNRVENANWAGRIGDGGWGYGMSYDYLKELKDYWVQDYDWKKEEKKLNEFPQFKVQIEGFDIHYYYEKGSGTNPQPVIFTHGWPGSVFEFVHAIDRLAHPEKYGGNAEDGLDVIVPSLPGFGFSSKPTKSPVGPVTTARLWNTLMTKVLGYESYGAQGGDLGCIVTTYLAYNHADHVKAIHLNLVPSSPKPENKMTQQEKEWAKEAQAFISRELDYFALQANKPQTPSFALIDSPLGTAAWIISKFKAWSDSGDDIESAFTKDQLLTNAMIYIVNDNIDSSIWFYRGFATETKGKMHPGEKIKVPTAVALFPADMVNGRPPKTWIEGDYNLVRYTAMSSGGHFACLEEPEEFTKDVLAYFNEILMKK
ncbi:epoxide hydrolase [Aquimarina sp. U1-2]|uniref:epoxide hydrolase family protein n=1 Tax=Aquimarina sp. U1-2 TaxID=2823141 RepID=UPI001AECBFCB|nr:epoxide hydrolase family protein [Aquimarina sp. U1-2]MBP2831851.1 epoxide hydrolase [Aquimarina sp. U1-2]